MPFSTPLFVWAFLPLVLLLYFSLRRELRNPLLLCVSLFFYAWGETFMVAILIVSCIANWGFGRWIDAAPDARTKKRALVLGIVFNIGLLVVFKYSTWLWTDILRQPLASLGALFAGSPGLQALLLDKGGGIHLPIGVSFFTFQGTSYLVDIYRGDVESSRSLVNFATYKSFFPQLIAGPIVRYRDVHDQIEKRVVTLEGFAYGVRRFVIGLGKKMLIANIVAAPCDKIFELPGNELTAPLAWLGLVCYTLQIYFDFSAYSDMAIGMGHMFGFKFLENFNYPYIARSVTDFWRRWHMSLSSWFRDYLYIPLGGNRISPARTYLNLVGVFFLCGLWHGASFSFVVWGLWHGVFLVIERAGLGAWLERRPALLRHAYLLLVAMLGWVFFRAAHLAQALDYLGALFGTHAGNTLLLGDKRVPMDVVHRVVHFTDAEVWTAIACGCIGAAPWLPRAVAWWQELAARGRAGLSATLEYASIGALALVFLNCAMKLAAGSYSPFIYFRF
jgi:alginate O-acetyltransferase complex protein AlgI